MNPDFEGMTREQIRGVALKAQAALAADPSDTEAAEWLQAASAELQRTVPRTTVTAADELPPEPPVGVKEAIGKGVAQGATLGVAGRIGGERVQQDRKSTPLNSPH